MEVTPHPGRADDPRELAARVVRALAATGSTLAVAESITGGRLASAITAIAGSSAVFTGGVVSYATRVKVDLLGVPAELVSEHGAVSEPCARSMARGVRGLLNTTYGVATTGVAGPGPSEGVAPGTLWVGVATPQRDQTQLIHLAGDRGEVLAAATEAALTVLDREVRALR